MRFSAGLGSLYLRLKRKTAPLRMSARTAARANQPQAGKPSPSVFGNGPVEEESPEGEEVEAGDDDGDPEAEASGDPGVPSDGLAVAVACAGAVGLARSTRVRVSRASAESRPPGVSCVAATAYLPGGPTGKTGVENVPSGPTLVSLHSGEPSRVSVTGPQLGSGQNPVPEAMVLSPAGIVSGCRYSRVSCRAPAELTTSRHSHRTHNPVNRRAVLIAMLMLQRNREGSSSRRPLGRGLW